MLEEAIQEVSQRYPVFPLALSVIEELQKAELEIINGKNDDQDKINDTKILAFSLIEELQPVKFEKKENKNEFENKIRKNRSKTQITRKDIVEDDDKSEETEDDIDEIITITYTSHEEELMINGIYGNSKVDYEKLFNPKINVKKYEFGETEYLSEKNVNDTKSETMSLKEASKMLLNIQYGALTGTNNGKNLPERRRFVNWTVFNQELLMLFHSLYSLTGDVDYSRTF